MARATSQFQQPDYGQTRAGEWNDLRSELVSLLDQVETQVARTDRQDPGLEGLTERVRDLRHQVEEAEPDSRRSYRFATADGGRHSTRDTLDAAIQQIKSRHFPRGEALVRQPDPSPRFDDMARSVESIAERLGRLEGELRNQGKGHTSNVKEIADQVGQLSQVVELLAGAVGETGQVKRLEGQIAALARLISDEQHGDAQGIARRIDDVSGTVSRLAELQKHYADRSDMSGVTQRLDDVSATVGRLVDLQAQIAKAADTTPLARRLDDVATTVGRLADLQVQFADRSSNNGLNERLDAVNAAIARVAQQQADAATRSDNPAYLERLDDVTQSVARIADIQARLAERADTDTIAQRIDDVTLTVGRLADLQVQVAQIVDNPRDGVREGIGAIEASVRTIYDRIDALERSVSVPAAEIEKVTEQLAKITGALRAPQPQGLIELVDALHTRISDIEARGVATPGLGADVDALRNAVLSAFEPRFAAMEQRLGDLAGRLDDRAADPATAQLEAQVRLLVARMDQTGEQLTGLARLYAQPAEAPQLPDLDQLADRIADRTAELARRNAPQPAASAEVDFDEIERRVARVVDAQSAVRPVDTMAGIERTIGEVNERLQRLEASLARSATPVAAVVAPIAVPAAAMEAVAVALSEPIVDVPKAPEPVVTALADAPLLAAENDPIAPLLRSLAEDDLATAPLPEVGRAATARRDAMPSHPGSDAPLVDRPFGDPSPVQRALEAKNGPRKRHPGLAEPEASERPPAPVPSFDFEIGPTARPSFDPAKVERPPQPRSSLDMEAPAVDGPVVAGPAEATEETSARNTFIAAHRRAARSGAQAPQTSVGGTSLIGRAFARLQRSNSDDVAAAKPSPSPAKPETKTKGKAKPEKTAAAKPADIVAAAKAPAARTSPLARLLPDRKLAGDKSVPTDRKRVGRVLPAAPEPTMEPLGSDAGPATASAAPAAPTAEKQSLLMRYRQPILLGAAVVALACLTINLINQRLAEQETSAAAAASEAAPVEPAPAEPAPSDMSDAALSPTPMAKQQLTGGPRVVPMVDSLETGAVAQSFAPADDAQPMPDAFEAATDLASTDDSLATGVAPLAPSLASPLKVEVPPEALGPENLRQAAANGDVRAQFEIAAIYTEGRAVPEDLKAAAVWYERAAAQGFAPAQYRLGNLYENGKGVEKDVAQARLWYQRAAEAGNRMAMHNLAAIYAGGALGTQEFDAAAKWFEEAAERGMKDSQFNLGMLYARGLGVKQDLAASYKWFALAALRGDADAAKARDDVAKSLDAASVQRLATEVAVWHPAPVDLVANFAPIGTWSKSFDPGDAITNLEVVKGVQSVLSQLGFDVGAPDGIAGPKTVIAIRSFERATGMSESGTINPRLLAVLGSQPV